MKIFYSELAENPAYFSFGYSIYAVLEDGDSVEDAYEKGFLPCIVAKDQPARTMYQTRGVRVLAQEFTRRHYHGRVARKVAELGEIEMLVHPLKDFNATPEFFEFFAHYFKFRFGTGAMPESRLRAILDSGWITHVSEYRLNGKSVAYMLEQHSPSFIHVWYQAYAKAYEHAHLGSYLYITLMESAKEAGKKHVYFGVTYGPWMRYKANFAPLEYWNGTEWIRDGNGKKLKMLLDSGISLVPYADRWRSERGPFYPVPNVAGFARETHFLQLLLDGAPRITLLILLIPILLVLYVVVQSFF